MGTSDSQADFQADRCYQDQMLDLEEAQALVLSEIVPVQEICLITLEQALGGVLAKDIHSPMNVPPHRNSAMDGYAIVFGQDHYQVVGTSWAGRPYNSPLKPGECVRIMTGACVPEGADTVVMQEHVAAEDGQIQITAMPQAGSNIREAGEDITQGSVVFRAGRCLSPIDLGVLASIGLETVEVYRRPVVALFCTGEEIKQPGEPLKPGEIYNSNRYQLRALLQQLGVEVLDLGAVKDDPNEIEKTIVQAAEQADALISTGGVSVGDADHVKTCLETLGKVGFWKVAIKPGKPFAFGQIRKTPYFGLPGNPVSSAVTYQILVHRALQKLQGIDPVPSDRVMTAVAKTAFKKRSGRKDFQRGTLSTNSAGDLCVSPLSGQGSHQLLALSEADCLVELEKESDGVKAGEKVLIRLL